MTFANPAEEASKNAAAYVAALLALLGDRDPLQVQANLVSELRRLLAGMDAVGLARPEAPGKWSVTDVVRHLAHTELVYAYRYRVTVAHDKPTLPGFDQNLWCTRLSCDSETPSALMDRLAAVRSWNLEFLRSVPADALTREGRHAERGWESLSHQIRLGAAHDLVHRNQIERIQKAIA